MSKFEKVILKILTGASDNNIKFDELLMVLNKLNFKERIKGSHRIFFKEGVEEIINIQPLKDGNAKPYQVKQVREIILKYRLTAK